jgi:hypothetical protein
MRDPKTFLKRAGAQLLQSTLAATVGATAAYAYAKAHVPPDVLATQKLVGAGYALAGAAAGLIAIKIAILGKTIIDDYRKGS